MDTDTVNRLKAIKIEDYIWLIYLGIIALSYISNYYEKTYLIDKTLEAKIVYRRILIIIFSILTLIYFYFLYDAFKSLSNIKKYDNAKKQKLVTLSFLAALLISISGLIYLYIAFVDENIDVELAFN